ncbi:hypothetical protein SmJEL517_g03000 [Synchytrium microbalum]|uniref:RED-like N-terminal domain-containing protein n=1 Tax=Synchytrium microbalum TaxID=1806994 RepID=A0A507BYI7_9FUNG|nr:uncharacterized protein SmJEL517_g03000 [Synchytrium microbalum]TPX34370.1 hypothetical protein SmJEL517_g03000 [Synchytrium microbalum]
MDQDAFRKLLATPRAPSSSQTPATPRTQQPEKQQKDNDGFAKPAPKKKAYVKPKSKEAVDDESSDSITYRDRAKERRQGVNIDYADSEQMLAVLEASNHSQPSAIVASTPTLVTSLDQAKTALVREQTKFLGGDVGHTHLVRGLDKTLLDKVRKEIGLTEDEKSKEEEAKAYIETLHGDGGKVEFNSRFAERVYTLAVKTPKEGIPLRNDLFLEGRMAFLWDLGMGEGKEYIGSTDLPTVVIRSKADVKDFDRKMQASSHEIVIDKIQQVMALRGIMAGDSTSTTGTSSEKKQIKRRDKERAKQQQLKQEEPKPLPAAMDVDDDGDIFAGVGRDYSLTIDDSRTKHPTDPTPPSTKPKYFDDDTDMTDTDASPALDTLLQQSANMVDTILGAGTSTKMVGATSTPNEYGAIPSHTHVPITPKKRLLEEEGRLDEDQMAIETSRQKKLVRMDVEDLDSESEGEEDAVKKPSIFDKAGGSSDGGFKKPSGDGSFKKGVKESGKEPGKGKPDKKKKFNAEYQQVEKLMSQKYGQKLGK